MKRALVLLLVVAATAHAQAPAAGDSGSVEQAVQLATPTGTLSGTLLVPRKRPRVPVVLIIAGSGPTDRDGNAMVLAGKNNSLKLLAEGLAAEGIASLRYDKRAIGASAAAGPKEADLRFDTYVADAAAWGAQLRTDARFTTLTILGHSEGSLIGMLAAGKAKADAYISIAGPARSAGSVLRDQLRPQLAPALWQASETILAALEEGKTTDSVPAPLFMLYRPTVQPYMISWFKYTPSKELARLAVPVLIIQGTTDIQVGVDEATALKNAKPEAQLAVIDGMNHVFKAVPADRAKQVASYSDPSLPIVPEILSTISAFVRGVAVR